MSCGLNGHAASAYAGHAYIGGLTDAHPDKPPRKLWSNWNKPGEQAHWCRGGSFYPSRWCWHYVRYEGQQVRTCLEYNVSVFQDGYIQCGFPPGCEECYRRFKEKHKDD